MTSTNHPGLECKGSSMLGSNFPMIPDNIYYMLAPVGKGSPAPWMEACCAGSPVNRINDCYVWCELPERLMQDKDRPTVSDDFNTCLRENNRPLNESRILSFGTPANSAPAAAGRGGLGVMGWGVVGLALVGVLGF
jgi:hypothetical protein